MPSLRQKHTNGQKATSQKKRRTPSNAVSVMSTPSPKNKEPKRSEPRREAARMSDNHSEKGENSEDKNDSDSSTDVSSSDESQSKEVQKKAAKKHRTYNYTVENTLRSNQRVERLIDDEDNDDSTTDTTAQNKLTPSAIWTGIDESMKQVKVEKTAVHDFVANSLFPKLKFIRGSGLTLDYSTEPKTICSMVMTGCHQEHLAEGMIWWAIARKQTINEIKRLRNDATKNLKIAFLGKCLVYWKWDNMLIIKLTYYSCGQNT